MEIPMYMFFFFKGRMHFVLYLKFYNIIDCIEIDISFFFFVSSHV